MLTKSGDAYKSNWEIDFKFKRIALIGNNWERKRSSPLLTSSFSHRWFATFLFFFFHNWSTPSDHNSLIRETKTKMFFVSFSLALFCSLDLCVYFVPHSFFLLTRTINWQSNVRRRHEINRRKEKRWIVYVIFERMNLYIDQNGSDGSRNKTNLAYNYIVSFDNDRQASRRTIDRNVSLCKETNTSMTQFECKRRRQRKRTRNELILLLLREHVSSTK